MKNILKVFLPIFIGIGLAVIILLSYFYFATGAFSPETAVTKYIKASMTQDINGMLKYASDYQKTTLYGSTDFTNRALKAMLKKTYTDTENIYKDSEITFFIESKTEIEQDSDEYSQIVEEYEFTAEKADFSAVIKIVVRVYVDGKQKQTNTVYAVKSGFGWYYGFNE